MDDNMWGTEIPRGYYKKLSLMGVPIGKGIIIGLVVIGCFNLNGTVFPKGQGLQFFLFMVLSIIMTIYLMIPTKGGFTNAHAILRGHVPKKLYYAIERNNYPSLPDTPKNRIPRKIIGGNK